MGAQYTAKATQDVATTASGLGAGAGDHLPIGDYGGMDYRSAIRFAIPAGWTGWTSIISAYLRVYISDHQHVGPKNSSINCSRMSVPWTKDQGSQDCESGFSAGNNTQYGDIGPSSIDRFSFSSGTTANAAKLLNVTDFIKHYWVNNSNPVFVFDNNGADQYTELWSLGKTGTTYDAELIINYETAAPPLAPTQGNPAAGASGLPSKPTFSWTHNDPDAQNNAAVRIWDATGTTLLYTWNPPVGSTQSLVAPIDLASGTTYQWDVATSDAVSGYGVYSAKRSFSTKANPVVTISTVRKMVFANGAPRLVVEWTTDQPQGEYRVTGPSGYDSTWKTGGEQSHTLDTLALTNGTVANITVEVRNPDSPALTGSASRSFTPRWGLTTHKKTLAGVPVNWQAPVVVATVPSGASLVIEYGSAGSAAAGAPTSGWFPSITSVPKTQYLWWRAWFIPSATASPVLDSINIPYDSTVAVLDKWGSNIVWPWENPGGLPNGFSIDTGEAVYGTRSLRVDVSSNHYINSTKMKVREGRTYVLSGLIRTQGDANARFRMTNAAASLAFAESPEVGEASVLTDWARYRSEVWVATADMDVAVQCISEGGTAGATAWFDGIKLEEAIVATPWNPASVGATTLDAGGVQIAGDKGGILRYRGTAGGVRDVVEGGVNGLKFGGDTEVSSPSAGLLVINGVPLFGAGPVFPTVKAVNDRWFRTDLGIEFFWDGTRWLSTTLYEFSFDTFNISAATASGVWRNVFYLPRPGGNRIRVVGSQMAFQVNGGTALGASHRWEVQTNFTPADDSVSVFHVNSGASGSQRRMSLTDAKDVAAAADSIIVYVTKVGTPGTLNIFYLAYSYRILGP